MTTILESFARLTRDRRHDLALWSRGERRELSFGDLAAEVQSWRAHVPATGGAPVAVAVGNCAAFPALVLALWANGETVAALDGGLPALEKVALCRRLGLPLLLHRDPGLEGEPLADGVFLSRIPEAAVRPMPADTVLIKLTSGSTGEPLGICLSAAALAAGIAQIAAGMEITARDRMLIAIPLSHSYGFDHGVLSLAAIGTPLVLEPTYFPASLLAALAQSEATFFPAVPPMVRALADSEWPGDLALRTVISAGGPLAIEFAARFRERSGRAVHQFYGSTETGGISFERAPEDPAATGTVGFPLPGVDISLDEQGTVLVASAANFQGHLGCSCRRPSPVALADRGEWTEEGRLRLVGRTADLLNVAGRRVSATAIEAALRHLPGVREAAVVGVADAVRGDRIVAFLVGTRCPFEASRLPQGLAARDLRYVEALPFTERGKLDRKELRAWASARA